MSNGADEKMPCVIGKLVEHYYYQIIKVDDRSIFRGYPLVRGAKDAFAIPLSAYIFSSPGSPEYSPFHVLDLF
jgi:hypothetical protein